MENKIITNAAAQQQMAQAQPAKEKTMQDYVRIMQGEIAKALPSVITPERFTRIVLSALSTTPALANCTPQSFLGAMMTAAQLGLEPNTPLGQAYLIPFRNNKKGVMECQFQLGYKGLLDLAYRSGEVSVIQAHEVCENDDFDYQYGLEPKLHHRPALGDRGKPIAYYAVFRMKDGGYGFNVASVEDIKAHARKYSQAFNKGSSPWQSAFDEMAKKTVLKSALRYAPLKSDFVRQTTSDETVKSKISEDMFSVPNETVIEVDEDTGELIEDAEITEVE